MKDLQAPAVTQYTLTNKSASGSIKYLALGDSLTAGVGASSYQTTLVYLHSQQLSKKYGQVQVINLGVPGATTEDLIKTQLLQVKKEKPDYITLLIGTNDLHNRVSKQRFRANFKAILENLKFDKKAKIVVMTIPYLGSDQEVLPPFNIILNFQTKLFNVIITTLVLGNDIKLVDLYGSSYGESFKNPDFYSADLFHPADAGYQLWSQILNDAD